MRQLGVSVSSLLMISGVAAQTVQVTGKTASEVGTRAARQQNRCQSVGSGVSVPPALSLSASEPTVRCP